MDSPSKILLVEGQDDKHVVRHLWKRCHQSEPSFDIEDKGSIDELLKAIGPEIKVPGRVVVGIVADANDDVSARWDAISNRLREAGGAPPKAPLRHGTIMGDPPRAGVWLMPDNRSPGELEDFVLEMVPRDDPVWPLAERYVRSIPYGTRKFRDGKTSRAEIHAWLATREEPGFMGAAIGRGDLEVDGPLCSDFLEWVTRLFG